MEHKERKHAIFAPSSMDRILKCPASIELSKGIEAIHTEESKEGTKAHEVAEYYLNKELGLDFKAISHEDNDMFSYAEEYAEFIEEQLTVFKPSAYFVEQKVVLNYICWGTVDFLAYRLNDNLTMDFLIVDYKYGMGDMVYAENNIQLMTYAICAIETFGGKAYKANKVDAYIYQPRKNNISHSEYNINALDGLKEKIDAYTFKYVAGINLNLGEINAKGLSHCKYCRAKPHCKAFKEETNKSLKIIDNKIPDANLLTNEEKVKIFTLSKPIKDFLNKIEQDLYIQSQTKEIEGVKLVEGRSSRVLEDNKKTKDYLNNYDIEDPYVITKKFIGIGAVQKILKERGYRRKEADNIISVIATVSDTTYKLVPDTDKRLAVSVNTAKKLMTNI